MDFGTSYVLLFEMFLLVTADYFLEMMGDLLLGVGSMLNLFFAAPVLFFLTVMFVIIPSS